MNCCLSFLPIQGVLCLSPHNICGINIDYRLNDCCTLRSIICWAKTHFFLVLLLYTTTTVVLKSNKPKCNWSADHQLKFNGLNNKKRLIETFFFYTESPIFRSSKLNEHLTDKQICGQVRKCSLYFLFYL